MATTTYSDQVVCVPRAGTLYDVLELILDRGMVIDVFIRVSLVGIEILKIDARIVIASVDTYLRFAEVCNRLDLEGDSRSTTVPELFGGGAARSLGRRKVRRAATSVGHTVRKVVGGRDDDSQEYEYEDEREEEQERPRRHAPSREGAPRRRRVQDER